MQSRPGKWKFVDKANGNQIFIDVANGDASTIKKAFDTANTALSPSNKSNLVGYDIAGRAYRYNSIEIKKGNSN